MRWPPRIFPREWNKSPILTSGFHAVSTVLGLMPYGFGIIGIAYFLKTTHSWLWIIASGWTLVWYWVREWKQNGLEVKPEWKAVPAPLPAMFPNDARRTLLERYDPWLDVGVPTLAYGLQLGLLGWLW